MEQAKLVERMEGYRHRDETTITHLEYGEPYAMKVVRTVREGAGYFVNPPISYLNCLGQTYPNISLLNSMKDIFKTL